MASTAPPPESRPDSTPRDSGTRSTWILVGALLAVCIVVPLLVPLYDQQEPELAGIPFFYWFQFLLIPIVSAITWVAFKLSQRAFERDREARGIRRGGAR